MAPALVKTTREKRRPRVRDKPHEGLEARAGTEMPSLMGGLPAPVRLAATTTQLPSSHIARATRELSQTRGRFIHMQRTIGNQAVQRLLRSHTRDGKLSTAGPVGVFIQRSPGVREDLQKGYKVKVEKGDKDWSETDLKFLQWALGKLKKKEAAVLAGYRIIRWSTAAARAKKDPTYKPQAKEECGLHEPDIGKKTYKISMYDKCFDKSTTMAGVEIGKYHILHEIGHAMEYAELRRAYEKYKNALDKYNAAVKKYNAASAAQQKKMEARVKALGKAEAAARKKYEAAQGRTISDFEKVVKGKPALTEYSKTSPQEAFAEAFALFKVDPKGVKKANKKLYNWFLKFGHLNPLK